MLIEKLMHYRINTGGSSTQVVNLDELIAIVLWLVIAYHNKKTVGLTLRGQPFCWRDKEVIRFANQDEAVSEDWVIQLLKDLEIASTLEGGYGPLISPTVHEWHEIRDPGGFRVQPVGELVGYYDRNGESILPIALRYSDDNACWYPVKQTDKYEGQELFVTRYRFDDLSFGQL